MRVQPRQQLLDIWRATVEQSIGDSEWQWGGPHGRDSISDAEQILCLLYPASAIRAFQLDSPDDIEPDVLDALRLLGDHIEIPKRLVRILTEYMRTYVDDSGTPDFSGDSYFLGGGGGKVTSEQRELHVVVSFSISMTLSLVTLGFVRVFRARLTRPALHAEVDALEQLASQRLSAAMVGLLRSFAVNTFKVGSQPWRTLLGTLSRAGAPESRVVDQLQSSLTDVRAGLRDLYIGSGQVDLDNPNLLFECGWSWGIVEDAPEIQTYEDVGLQRAGTAVSRPSLYFTIQALAGAADLFSERTRALRLLNEEQQRLAAALQIRWDLTRQYWATIAGFDPSDAARWPLEDLPWRTTDGTESDYYSLLLTSVVVQDLQRRSGTNTDLRRVHQILVELASRARVTRRPARDDRATVVHSPGVSIALEGAEEGGGPRLVWQAADFAMLLLKGAVTVAAQARTLELRGDALTLVEEVWRHLADRRLADGPGCGLWDQPGVVFPNLTLTDRVSWSHTNRVSEGLVLLASVIEDAPLRSEPAADLAMDLLAEAEHLFDQELLVGPRADPAASRARVQRIRATLRRARTLVRKHPVAAAALASDLLLELDALPQNGQNLAGTSLHRGDDSG
ncbi:SCO2524 family protein [Cryptosporangium minutisporangium]|uniref:SCO2524 family protein n=1 Tax=Cryptosporangium minutisporangium TaxID=113569 RepID=A0ABP6T415_9ACTN